MHHPDGSGIQCHSAGGLYPLVIVARESAFGLLWGVQGPADVAPSRWFVGPTAYDDAHAEGEEILARRQKPAEFAQPRWLGNVQDNRDQAGRIAQRAGYSVRSVNMIG